MAYKHDDKSSGQLIRSADWNTMGHEIERLETDKINRTGDTIKGDLTVSGKAQLGSLAVTGDASINGKVQFGPLAVTGDVRIIGNVGIGVTNPQAKIDIAAGDRSGTHAQNRPLYVTGNIGPADNGVEFRHSNATQGIGFGYHTIYATGTNADQDLNMMPRGNGKVGVGTTAPETKLHVNGDLKVNGTIYDAKGAIIPRNIVVMWSGGVNAIPSGWALCDGNNGTPDLRDRFIVGSGKNYQVGATGGANEVTLTISQIPSHNHSNGAYKYLLQSDGNGTSKSTDYSVGEPNIVQQGEIVPQGGSQPHENRPPYYALCFIMKL